MLVRQTLADLSDGSVRLTAEAGAIVFLPGAPTALSGSVALVEGDRIAPTMRRLGAGLAGLRR